jgi:shikimate dehydrogenase
VISGSSRLLVILGEPVSHSLSPAMQNAAFRVLGLDAVYVALPCTATDLPALLRAVARSGGAGNITVPHKEAAARAVEVCTPLAETVEACNTFWNEDGEVIGDNTDVPGVLAALHELEIGAAPWFIAGTGGGAKAAIVAAGQHGAGVAIGSRDSERQRACEAWVRSRGVTLVTPAECGVLINATPLGLRSGDPWPIDPAGFPQARAAFDMVYTPGETRWVQAMRTRLGKAADGRAMLVAQGAAAFERWFPGRRAPVDVMRATVDAALR